MATLGPLNQRVQIQRQIDGAWLNMAGSRWASVAPVSGDERFAGGVQLVASERVEFRMRWSGEIADLAPPDRIVYPVGGDVTYDIKEVSMLGRQHGFRVTAVRHHT